MLDPSIKRSDVPEEFTWRLEDMYPTDKAWAEENEALRALVPEVAAFSGRLGESADTLLSFFRLSGSLRFTATRAAAPTRTRETAFIRICAARR